MNTNKLWSTLVSVPLLVLLLVLFTSRKTYAQDAQVSYQTFYDDLSPYGQWVTDGQYGNVWVPNEPGDFRPYGSSGHWVMTDYGNTWVSDDPWGWACYHYGRWTYDQYYGWVWIPGYEWAPAWVSWRYGGGYSGWAPLGPGMAIDGGGCPDSWWVFVQPTYLYDRDFYHHWRGPSYNSGYIRQTELVHNAYVDNGTHVRYNYGPKADVIQHDTHHAVQVYHVSAAGRPGAPGVSGNNVSLYRPAVNKATANTARPANAIAAPRQISKPQAATGVSAGHQPAFRQQVQQGHPGGNPQPANRSQPGQQPQQQNRPQPAQQHQQPQPQNRPQPAQQRPQPQPQNRPQPQQNRPQPMPQQRPQPQQQRPQPQPQRPQPMQQAPRPMPQAPRPQPMQQTPRPQPMQQAPHAEPPHEGGGRR